MGIESGLHVSGAEQFAQWLDANGDAERELWTIIYKKASKRQTVTFDQLLEEALCHGWVDVQTKSVDDERYGIRFVPRKMGSNWSATNRSLVCRLLAAGRMKPSGSRLLPPDLECHRD